MLTASISQRTRVMDLLWIFTHSKEMTDFCGYFEDTQISLVKTCGTTAGVRVQ